MCITMFFTHLVDECVSMERFDAMERLFGDFFLPEHNVLIKEVSLCCCFFDIYL